MLAEHDGIVAQIHADAAWPRAVADHAATTGRPIRLVTSPTPPPPAAAVGHRLGAARPVRPAGHRRSGPPFAVSAETRRQVAPRELAAHLVCSPEAVGLSGAELVAGAGWFGLRSHPRPVGSISFGGPESPAGSTTRSERW